MFKQIFGKRNNVKCRQKNDVLQWEASIKFPLVKITIFTGINFQIHNLGRFISVMKFRPLVWRNNHPYLLADRVEDITDQEKVSKARILRRPRHIKTYSWFSFSVQVPILIFFSFFDNRTLNLGLTLSVCP